MGDWVKYIFLPIANLFLQFLYYRRRNKRIKTVVSMLSGGALERSNSPFIESIVEPCVSKNRKEIFAMWVWLGRKSSKRVRRWKNVSLSSRMRNLCTCVLERKIEITVVILRYQKCWSLLFKKDFKIPELLPKHPFFTLETVLKMPKETNKGDVESICKRVTKPASKKVANAEFIWIDYK